MENNKDLLLLMLKEFYPYAKKRLGFDKNCKVSLVKDCQNAQNPLGKTAYYDPKNMQIKVFITDRHPKDILRSVAHELVHHSQNCRGDLNNAVADEGYAQKDGHLRKMEQQAYLEGNMMLRDFEDQKKLKEGLTMKKKTVIKDMDWREKMFESRNMRLMGSIFAQTGLTFNPLNEEEMMTGGLADDKDETDFDPKQLQKGMEVEMEHTSDEQMAKEIAMDHLTEDPLYYQKLEKMEAENVQHGSVEKRAVDYDLADSSTNWRDREKKQNFHKKYTSANAGGSRSFAKNQAAKKDRVAGKREIKKGLQQEVDKFPLNVGQETPNEKSVKRHNKKMVKKHGYPAPKLEEIKRKIQEVIQRFVKENVISNKESFVKMLTEALKKQSVISEGYHSPSGEMPVYENEETLVTDIKEMIMANESKEDIMQMLLRGSNMSLQDAEKYYSMAEQAVRSGSIEDKGRL